MTDDDFEKYKMLSEEVKYNHDRWDVMVRTLLTIHGFIIAGIAVLYNNKTLQQVSCLIVVLSLLGIAICVLGYFALIRIHDMSQLRFYQLRKYEEDEKNKNNHEEKPWKNIFTYGKKFMRGDLENKLYEELYKEEILCDYKRKVVNRLKRGKYSNFAFLINTFLGIFYGITNFISGNSIIGALIVGVIIVIIFKKVPQLICDL